MTASEGSVDVNPGMIDVARAHSVPEGAPIEWRQGDAMTLDLPDGTFDVVPFSRGCSSSPTARRARGRCGGCWRTVDVSCSRSGRGSNVIRCTRRCRRRSAASRRPRRAGEREEVGAPFSLGDADDLRTLLTDAGFRDIEIASRSIEARFATPGRFVERMEFAYAAVVPQFVEDPAAFAAYLETIGRETKAIVERYREGDWIAVPMHTHIAVAHA